MNNKQFSKEELKQIDTANDLHIAPFREDARLPDGQGKTYGTPNWIWEVVINGELYVRAYNGVNSRWYQSAVKQKAGRIIAAGMTKDVLFELVHGEMNNAIDEA